MTVTTMTPSAAADTMADRFALDVTRSDLVKTLTALDVQIADFEEKAANNLNQGIILNKTLKNYRYAAGRVLSELRETFVNVETNKVYGKGWLLFLETTCKALHMSPASAQNYIKLYRPFQKAKADPLGEVAAKLGLLNETPALLELQATKPKATPEEICQLQIAKTAAEQKRDEAIQKSANKDLERLREQFGNKKGTTFSHTTNLAYTVTVRDVPVDEIAGLNKDALVYVRLTVDQLRKVDTVVDWVTAEHMTVDNIRKLLESVGYKAAPEKPVEKAIPAAKSTSRSTSMKAKGAAVN